jgi:hypothetical protein
VDREKIHPMTPLVSDPVLAREKKGKKPAPTILLLPTPCSAKLTASLLTPITEVTEMVPVAETKEEVAAAAMAVVEAAAMVEAVVMVAVVEAADEPWLS